MVNHMAVIDFPARAVDPERTVARLTRAAREAAKMTQAELARRTGMSQSAISGYEVGARQPSLPTLIRILEATGHTLDLRLVDAADLVDANGASVNGKRTNGAKPLR